VSESTASLEGRRKEDNHSLSSSISLPSLPPSFLSVLSSILETERSIPLWKPALLTLCFFGIIVIDVLKGGEGAPSPLGFQCGSLGYWLVTLSAIPWVGWEGGREGGREGRTGEDD
jgi:hypothetical protein